jgi:hypothetical protein
MFTPKYLAFLEKKYLGDVRYIINSLVANSNPSRQKKAKDFDNI